MCRALAFRIPRRVKMKCVSVENKKVLNNGDN